MGFDNYTWTSVFFFVAAVESFYMYKLAMRLAAAETDPKIIDMRHSSAYLGIFVFTILAIAVLIFRNKIRKYSTRYYDFGNNLSHQVAFIAWLPIVLYVPSLFVGVFPGTVDFLFFGIGLLFLISEPPPMEQRMNRTFRDTPVTM